MESACSGTCSEEVLIRCMVNGSSRRDETTLRCVTVRSQDAALVFLSVDARVVASGRASGGRAPGASAHLTSRIWRPRCGGASDATRSRALEAGRQVDRSRQR
jgi:hypothetical protein